MKRAKLRTKRRFTGIRWYCLSPHKRMRWKLLYVGGYNHDDAVFVKRPHGTCGAWQGRLFIRVRRSQANPHLPPVVAVPV